MIQNISYKDQVYEYLEKAIIKGELKAGEMYSEQYFAQMLRISRTPVREAVLQLQYEGLVEIFYNRGFKVRELVPEAVYQAVQVCITVEGCGLSQLARQIRTPGGQEALKVIQECLEQEEGLLHRSQDPYEYVKAYRKFHYNLVGFTGNTYFMRLLKQARVPLERLAVQKPYQKSYYAAALQDQQAILAWIGRGEEKKAADLLRKYICKEKIMCYIP